jgi:DNA primase
MARIPQAEIDRIQREVSVERLVESAGIELKKKGQELNGLCPFHPDKNPSLFVNPGKNEWHCFACDIGGGPLEWVVKMQGVSFRHAFELLDNDVALAAGKPVRQSTVPKLPPPVRMDADEQALLNETVIYYRDRCKQTPEALAYAVERGLNHPEVIDTFSLGFADRSLGLRLPEKNRKAGAEIRSRLQKIGILRASGHEHFNGSLTIPIYDVAGNVVEVYGRKLNHDARTGQPKHLYLPGPHRGVWNLAALQASKEIILCEALIDALTFWCAGYRNVTASYGVEGFTAEHLAAFKQYGTQRVLIAYDRDDAGERAAEKLAQELIAQGIECYRIQFPKGMDANEYALKVTPAAKSLGIAIRKAVWLGRGVPPRETPQAESVASAAGEQTPSLAAKEKPAPAALPPPPPDVVVNAPVLPASPLPPLPANEPLCAVRENEIVLSVGDRRYRVRGLAKNLSFDLLKVNLLAARGEAFYVDTLDLYAAKARASYVTQAALELQVNEDIVKTDLGRVLLKLEALQEAAINDALKPQAPTHPEMSEAEREAALALLRAPNLIERIDADFDLCGLVGERTNKIVGYLAAISRKLERPLGVVIQSSSAAGKTTLLDAVLAFVPDEERVKYSAMTGQSLFYMGETNLKHKALAIVEEEGASRASYALKLLQSEGELTIASTGKDPTTGNLITQQYRVEGPVALLLTTTARDLDEELLNRCLLLAVDESREQTRSIHRLQRERRTLEGIAAKRAREQVRALQQNAQRLLRPLEVFNPYVRYLTFGDQTTRLRRDHEKYLTLIDTITLLHQYQRATKVAPGGSGGGEPLEYIEVTLDDIALANTLAHEVLGRSLDELPPQTRRLLRAIDAYVAGECTQRALRRTDVRFSRRALRESVHWSDTQLRVHLERLVELEYVLVRREGPGGKFIYELVYETSADDASVRLPGLIDIEALKTTLTTAQVAGQMGEVAGRSRADRGPLAEGSRTDESAAITDAADVSELLSAPSQKTHVHKPNGKDPSYPHTVAVAAAAR